MNKEKFLAVSESLRQYRRAELKDFDKDLGNSPCDRSTLYRSIAIKCHSGTGIIV